MKLALTTLGVLALIAGTASAALFGSSDQNGTAATLAPKPLAPVVASTVPLPEPARRAPAPLFKVKGEPVPQLGLAKHMPYVAPAADDKSDSPPQALATEPLKMGEDAARAAITTDGYKSIRSITRAADGSWTARVLRGNTEIGVTVSADGRVSAD
ncbi:MAG TPA: hypothetical protein VMI56_00195 [Reyranella sp.]|nr:hypothetical protein [Reyranella sp.]